jgi:predicted permease
MDSALAREMRQAFRALVRAPRFTLVVSLTLALAVGTNTIVFSAVSGILLQPLPFRDAGRVVGIYSTAPGLGYPQFPLSAGVFFAYKDEARPFENMGIYQQSGASLTGGGDPEIVRSARMSASVFSTLGAVPLRGRIQSAEEDLPGGSPVALISEGLWARRFGSDPDILGKTLRVDGHARQVIGVMPASFTFPEEHSDVWLPLGIDPEQADPGSFSWNAVGRIKPGLSPEDAQAQMQALAARLPERYPGDDAASLRAFLSKGAYGVLIRPYKETIVGSVRTPLWILLGSVGCVLLIACVNVANLLLVRTENKQRELAVRAALGAGRKGLLVRSFAESAILATLGGLGGLLLAAVGVPMLLRAAPPTLPRLDQVGLDAPVLLFTLAVTALSAALFTLIPVARYSGPHLLTGLGQSARGSSVGPKSHRMRSTLVVAQTALALILMVGSGLLFRSFREIRQANPGFVPRDVLAFRLSLPETRYPSATQVAAFHEELLGRLRGLPGVQSVGAASNLPLGVNAQGTAFEVEGFPVAAGDVPPMFWYKYAAPGYFETVGIPVVSGRTFVPADHESNLGNVIINTVVARRYWPGEDAVGKRIRFAGDSAGWYAVVGVVGETKERGLRTDPIDQVYLPMVAKNGDDGWRAAFMTYVIKAHNPEALVPAVRAQVSQMDADLPVASVRTMDEMVADSVVRLSFTMLALAISAVIALLLGAVGLYGVLSYVVTQRTREIGIRMALGAEAESVLRLVVGQGARTAATGVGVGLLGALGLTRFLRSLLYETAPLNVPVLLEMSLLLFGVGLAATYLPARRASQVDPATALKTE